MESRRKTRFQDFQHYLRIHRSLVRSKILWTRTKEKLSKVKKQAQNKLKRSAKVKREYTVTAISNPKIKRGDTVYVDCGTAGIKGNKTVKSISHDCVAGTMDVVFIKGDC